MSNPHKSGLTDKQYKILVVLCDGNGKDVDDKFIPCDLDELLDRLSYRTTKASMQFSIRALVKHRLVEKGAEARRGAKRATYTPTRLARQVMGYQDPSFIEPADLDLLDL